MTVLDLSRFGLLERVRAARATALSHRGAVQLGKRRRDHLVDRGPLRRDAHFVRQGVVSVYDHVMKKTITVHAGRSYLAKPKK